VPSATGNHFPLLPALPGKPQPVFSVVNLTIPRLLSGFKVFTRPEWLNCSNMIPLDASNQQFNGQP
jgi:hypothetical protein